MDGKFFQVCELHAVTNAFGIGQLHTKFDDGMQLLAEIRAAEPES